MRVAICSRRRFLDAPTAERSREFLLCNLLRGCPYLVAVGGSVFHLHVAPGSLATSARCLMEYLGGFLSVLIEMNDDGRTIVEQPGASVARLYIILYNILYNIFVLLNILSLPIGAI
jgi:hypothetical protein